MPTERQMAELLVSGKPRTVNLLAMGLFQYYKWDEIKSKENQPGGHQVSDADFLQISNSFTKLNWDDFQDTAEETVRAITASDQKWLVPIAQGVISAFVYSFILVIVLVIVKWNGVDILHAFGIEPKVTTEAPAAPNKEHNPGGQ